MKKGSHLTKEQKERLSLIFKGRETSLATRMKISEKIKGRKLSLEHRAKLGAIQIGRKRSAETREKLSIKAKERCLDPLKISPICKKGKTISEETRAKLQALKGEKHSQWKGGRHGNGHGYIVIHNPSHPNAQKNGYMLEHRFVMAEKLGRPLVKGEDVHHINGIKDDNRPENLAIITKSGHTKLSPWCGRCELRKEIRLLRWQIKELSAALQLKLGEGIV